MPRISHGGDCLIEHMHKLDNPAFEKLTGMTKDTFKATHGPCDVVERRASTDEDPEEFLKRNKSTEKSYPKAELGLTEMGDDYIPSCVNHAQLIRGVEKRTMFDLGNLRGDKLNPGESNEARWHFKQRAQKLFSRANDHWNTMVRERNRSRFNSGNPTQPTGADDRNEMQDDDTIETFMNNETSTRVPDKIKNMVNNQKPFWMD
jgi:hypothetical protein